MYDSAWYCENELIAKWRKLVLANERTQSSKFKERTKAESYMLQHEKRAQRSQSELAQSAKAAWHIQSLLHGRNVFTLIYTCFVGTFFPFVNLRCLRRIIDIVLHFCCASSIEPSHKWRHTLTWIVLAADTWLFIILTQIINGSNVPTERNSIWTNKVNICTRSSTNRPIK